MLFKIQLIALAGLLPHVLGQTRNNGQACSDSTYYEPDPATYKAGNRVPVPKDEAISPDGFSHNFGEGVIGTVHFEHFTSSDKTSYYSLHVRIDNGANTRKTVLLGSYYHEDPKDPTTVPGEAVVVSADPIKNNDDCLAVEGSFFNDVTYTLQTDF